MFDADLYKSFSSLQQEYARDIFKEFLSGFESEQRNWETVLDVGCGPGDTFVEQILPQFEKKPLKVVGIDRSKDMVNLAREKFPEDFLEFREVDIQCDFSEIDKRDHERFDLVTSFFVYNFIRDERNTLDNIYKTMRVGGSFLMIFPVRCSFFDVIIKMSQNEKYKKYIEVGRYIGPYVYESDPVSVLKSKLIEAGFKPLQVEMRDCSHQFQSFEQLEKSFQSVNPFKPPKELYKEFIRECALDVNENFLNSTLNFTYQVIVSIVKK